MSAVDGRAAAAVPAKLPVELEVNGAAVRIEVEPRTHLADALREELGFTGTHLGCEHGVCGACTVMLDGQPSRSCIAFAGACDGARVRTVEGFDDDPLMAALREAFSANHALQCGYCTPGMLISAYDIVRRLPGADEQTVRRELSGNLCRCTGYRGIVDAVVSVAAAWPGLSEQAGAAAMLLEPLPSRPAFATLRGGTLPLVSAAAVQEAGVTVAGATVITDGADANRIARRVELDVPADALWEALRAVDEVVQCMPGMSLLAPPERRDADTAEVRALFAVAVGPMRARFEADARLRYEPEARRGRIDGEGFDAASRTRATGKVEFEVSGDAQHSELTVAIGYELEGGLAQYSRGAVIDAVTDELLARFASNVARLARGETVVQEQELGGTGLVVAAFWARLKRFFSFLR